MERTISLSRWAFAGRPRYNLKWHVLMMRFTAGHLPVYAMRDNSSKAGHAHIQSEVAKYGFLDKRTSRRE